MPRFTVIGCSSSCSFNAWAAKRRDTSTNANAAMRFHQPSFRASDAETISVHSVAVPQETHTGGRASVPVTPTNTKSGSGTPSVSFPQDGHVSLRSITSTGFWQYGQFFHGIESPLHGILAMIRTLSSASPPQPMPIGLRVTACRDIRASMM